MVLSPLQETLYTGKHETAWVSYTSPAISCLEVGDSCPEQSTHAERRVAKADDTRLSWHRHVHPNSNVSGGDTAVPSHCISLLPLPPGCTSCLTHLALLWLMFVPDNVILLLVLAKN